MSDDAMLEEAPLTNDIAVVTKTGRMVAHPVSLCQRVRIESSNAMEELLPRRRPSIDASASDSTRVESKESLLASIEQSTPMSSYSILCESVNYNADTEDHDILSDGSIAKDSDVEPASPAEQKASQCGSSDGGYMESQLTGASTGSRFARLPISPTAPRTQRPAGMLKRDLRLASPF
jgi:hypothetical protein